MQHNRKVLLACFIFTVPMGAFAAVVTNDSDSGPGSLRQAILDANASGGGTINFTNVFGTISLASALPVLTSTINLAGPGPALLTVTAMAWSIFTNAPGNTASLSGLRLTSAGTAYGSAIANLGSLAVSNCVITQGAAVQGTPGIWNSGILTASGCLFSSNRGYEGGAIHNSGTMQLTHCIVTNNHASFGAGSGIFNEGDLTADDCAIVGNSMQPDSAGGGIYNVAGTLVLRNCSVSDNFALDGGGIWNSAQLAMTNCTLCRNRATYSNGPIQGGGLRNSGSAVLLNTTVSGNSALGSGGGILNLGKLLLLSSTIVSNVTQQDFGAPPADGGGVFNSDTFQTENSLFAGNTAATQGPDIYGNLDSLGHNLILDVNGWTNVSATAGDLVGIDPQLGPLQDNGGPGWTHALLPRSPAVDAGDTSSSPPEDERGVHRPQGLAADIGAFEFQFNVPLFVRVAIQHGTNLWLQACGLPFQGYALYGTQDFRDWGKVATLTAGADGVLEYVEYGYRGYPKRCYELQATSP